MPSPATKLAPVSTFCCLLLLASAPAQAFRCGNKLVLEGMHATQVTAVCGEPQSRRSLGFVVRAYIPGHYRRAGLRTSSYYGDAGYGQEVIVTEFVYNFGPRKLMRVLRFEGGILTYIETAGYGYLEN